MTRDHPQLRGERLRLHPVVAPDETAAVTALEATGPLDLATHHRLRPALALASRHIPLTSTPRSPETAPPTRPGGQMTITLDPAVTPAVDSITRR